MVVTTSKGGAMRFLSIVLLSLLLFVATGWAAQDQKMGRHLNGDPGRLTGPPGAYEGKEREREVRLKQGAVETSPDQEKTKADPKPCNETTVAGAKGPGFPWSPSNPLGYRKMPDTNRGEEAFTGDHCKDESSPL